MTWIIAIFSIWSYPVITFYIIKRTRDNLRLRRKIVFIVASVSLIAILGLATGLSATLLEIDAIFITSLYFIISLGIWTVFENKRKFIRAIGIVLIVIVFGLGYLSGTIGALGIGFITASFEPNKEKWYHNGIIYKETSIGNAISDFRGKEVEVYKTIKWLPIVEWRLSNKKYYILETYRNPLQVKYLENSQTFILSLPDSIKIKGKAWADTLRVE